MKILYITNVIKEGDWRFWDLEADVYEVDEANIRLSDCHCSVCELHKGKKIDTVKVVLPFKEARKLI